MRIPFLLFPLARKALLPPRYWGTKFFREQPLREHMPLIIILILLFGGIHLYMNTGNEVTIYPVECNSAPGGKGTFCDLPLNKTTYRLFPETGEVVYWMPGIETPIRRISGCTIGNRDNWSCTFSDHSGGFGMKDGKYFDWPSGSPNLKYVEWWRWWYLHLKSWSK